MIHTETNRSPTQETANLQAAAPAMLAALKALVDRLLPEVRDRYGDFDTMQREADYCDDLARAAIAQAEGEA